MPEAEFTIQYFDPAKPGKKYGSIKTAEGQKYLVKAAMSRSFSKNEVCKVSYHTEQWSDQEVMIIDNKVAGAAVPHPQVRASVNPKDSKQIFVTALLKEYIGLGSMNNVEELIARGEGLKKVYDRLFGDAQKQESEATFNDSIEF